MSCLVLSAGFKLLKVFTGVESTTTEEVITLQISYEILWSSQLFGQLDHMSNWYFGLNSYTVIEIRKRKGMRSTDHRES
jgi:hypothetical protein